MLVERNPWLMVVGSDSPTFVLYDSNRAIWRANGEDGPEFRTDVLTDEEANDLQSMADALLNLDEYISLSDWTDQPTQEIYFWSSNGLAQRTLYGSLRSSQGTTQGESKVRQVAPEPFLNLFDALANFNRTNAESWTPEYVEVMIWPYDYAPDESIEWPADWPDIYSPTTIRRGDSYSLYVPYSEKPKLTEFLKSRNAKGAVLISEHKWAAAIRTPLPHEVDFGKN